MMISGVPFHGAICETIARADNLPLLPVVTVRGGIDSVFGIRIELKGP